MPTVSAIEVHLGTRVSDRVAAWNAPPARRVPARRFGLSLAGLVSGLALTAGALFLTAGPASAIEVKVAPGETVWALAGKYGTSVAAITAANHLTDASLIDAGQVLDVPSAARPATSAPPAPLRTVVVQAGETLSAIAQQDGSTVGEVAAVNRIANPDLIRIGQKLVLPAAVSGAAAVASSAVTTSSWSGGFLATAPLPPQLMANPQRLAMAPLFRHWAEQYRLPPSLLEALDWWESGWQQGVTSCTGAVGTGQLEPATVTFVRSVLLGDPQLNPAVASDNIQMSARLLRFLVDQNGGSVPRALASYYEGLAAVRHGILAPTTARYVLGILAWQHRFALAGG